MFESFHQLEKNEEAYIVHTDKSTYSTKNIVLATGFYDLANSLNIPGEDLPKVSHYYKDPHYYALQKVAIVGASNSAVDAALETWRKGAEVTLIVRGKSIGERVKYWVKPDIENRIKEGSIQAFFETEIAEIKQNSLVLKNKEETIEIENDFVLALTGYQPNFDLLELLGVSYKSNPFLAPSYKEETMESDVKGIYLAGVVCGGLETHKWFIENSRVHAEKIVLHIQQSMK